MLGLEPVNDPKTTQVFMALSVISKDLLIHCQNLPITLSQNLELHILARALIDSPENFIIFGRILSFDNDVAFLRHCELAFQRLSWVLYFSQGSPEYNIWVL